MTAPRRRIVVPRWARTESPKETVASAATSRAASELLEEVAREPHAEADELPVDVTRADADGEDCSDSSGQEPREADLPTETQPISRHEALAHFEANRNLADDLAAEICTRIRGAIELCEIQAAARVGLWQAARRFDSTRGLTFIAWAAQRVRGSVIDLLRAYGIVVRRGRTVSKVDRLITFVRGRDTHTLEHCPTEEHAVWLATFAAHGGLSVARTPFHTTRDGPSPEGAFALAEEGRLATRALATLDPANQELMELYYLGDATLEEVGLLIGRSKSWMSRLHATLLEQVRKRFDALVDGRPRRAHSPKRLPTDSASPAAPAPTRRTRGARVVASTQRHELEAGADFEHVPGDAFVTDPEMLLAAVRARDVDEPPASTRTRRQRG